MRIWIRFRIRIPNNAEKNILLRVLASRFGGPASPLGRTLTRISRLSSATLEDAQEREDTSCLLILLREQLVGDTTQFLNKFL
jgi:hypothetical protein